MATKQVFAINYLVLAIQYPTASVANDGSKVQYATILNLVFPSIPLATNRFPLYSFLKE